MFVSHLYSSNLINKRIHIKIHSRIASWIPAAMTTTALAMAPVASALCQRLNCRLVTAAGKYVDTIDFPSSNLGNTYNVRQQNFNFYKKK